MRPLVTSPLPVRGLLAVATLLAAGCFAPVELPAPRAPSREVPAVGAHLAPAAPGRQWVVLDVPGDAVRVSTYGDAAGQGEGARELCVTPCVAELGAGAHKLFFTSGTTGQRDELEVQAQTEPVVVRHVLSTTRSKAAGTAGIALTFTGLLVALGGAITIPSQAAVEAEAGNTANVNVGLSTLGGGVFVLGVGVLLGYLGRGEYTPGSTTEWTIPGATGPASGAPAAKPLSISF